jgi:hypothetical protein
VYLEMAIPTMMSLAPSHHLFVCTYLCSCSFAIRQSNWPRECDPDGPGAPTAYSLELPMLVYSLFLSFWLFHDVSAPSCHRRRPPEKTSQRLSAAARRSQPPQGLTPTADVARFRRRRGQRLRRRWPRRRTAACAHSSA